MDVFDLRRRVIDDYASYVRSFFAIRDERIRAHVDAELEGGRLWPERRLVLERYAALATAIATHTPDTSPLAPPPASPLAAHPERP